MGLMSAAEIRAYVASGEALGKAGAYALQETGDRFVERIEGSFTNVVGLPMELLERMLKAAGHDPKDFRDLD
jgi:septum formation protein